jgi:ADP-ribose pyrophosphatase YjhB (NUDIX family)
VEWRGTVVLIRNKGWPEELYGIVTGFLEKGETPEAGIIREVREELGIDGTIEELVGLYSFFEMNQLILVYHVTADDDIVAGDEIAGWKNIEPDRLRPKPFGTGYALIDWLKNRQNAAGKK